MPLRLFPYLSCAPRTLHINCSLIFSIAASSHACCSAFPLQLLSPCCWRRQWTAAVRDLKSHSSFVVQNRKEGLSCTGNIDSIITPCDLTFSSCRTDTAASECSEERQNMQYGRQCCISRSVSMLPYGASALCCCAHSPPVVHSLTVHAPRPRARRQKGKSPRFASQAGTKGMSTPLPHCKVKEIQCLTPCTSHQLQLLAVALLHGSEEETQPHRE